MYKIIIFMILFFFFFFVVLLMIIEKQFVKSLQSTEMKKNLISSFLKY